jgi:very-short-patch-repair endonuclease
VLSPFGGGRGRIYNEMLLNEMNDDNFYNKNHKPFAHDLRKNMTKAEVCLWKYALRAGKMKGYSFRHQRPVLRFIVDLIYLELKLIIEMDGYSHFLDEVVIKDMSSDKALRDAWFTVLRFSDSQVLKDMSNVVLEIEKQI